jgi:hypothetical protein
MEGHPLAGHFSVDTSARLIRHYRYVEERMMRVMGGWIALTPELPAKLLLGRHVWDCAQHADLWGRRLPELRAAAQQSEPANQGVVTFMDLLEAEEGYPETPQRLVGMYRVLKPHLVSVYERHLARANPVYEPPTRRILERCLDEERRHAAAGQIVLEHLTVEADRSAQAEAWEARLGQALAAAGGITGDAPVVPASRLTHARAHDDVLALGQTSSARHLPEDLAQAIDRHRRAVAEGDFETVAAQVIDLARDGVQAAYRRLSPPLTGSELVAVAAIGSYRMIKLAFTGPHGLAVVQQRWRRIDDGWRMFGAEVVRIEPAA